MILQGKSSLFNGERREKDDELFESLGEVDELCCLVGVALAHTLASEAFTDPSSNNRRLVPLSLAAELQDIQVRSILPCTAFSIFNVSLFAAISHALPPFSLIVVHEFLARVDMSLFFLVATKVREAIGRAQAVARARRDLRACARAAKRDKSSSPGGE